MYVNIDLHMQHTYSQIFQVNIDITSANMKAYISDIKYAFDI